MTRLAFYLVAGASPISTHEPPMAVQVAEIVRLYLALDLFTLQPEVKFP